MRLPLLLSFLFFHMLAICQPGSQYRIREYSTENGMPSNGVKGMQWDAANRFLWIATEAGITRFNGMGFKNFSRDNTPGISSDRTLFIIRNSAGEILSADLEGNIFRVVQNRIQFKEYGFSKNGPGPGHNNFYLLPVSERFFRKKMLPESRPAPALNINKVLPVSDTSCHILFNGGLYHYNLDLDSLQPLKPGLPKLKTAFIINNEHFAVTPENAIYHIISDGNYERTEIVSDDLRPLKLNSGGFLYVWENGMESPVLFNGNNAWLLQYRQNKIVAKLLCDIIPPNSFIRCAQYDAKDDILFVGTESKGIIMISHNQMNSLRNERTSINERNAYYAQLELPNGNILTNEGHIIGPSVLPAGELPVKGKFNFSLNLLEDSLLFYNQVDPALAYNCLHAYSYRTGLTKVFPKIMVRELAIVTRSRGRIYLATDRGIGVLEDDSMRILMNNTGSGYVSIAYDLKEVSPGILAYASCNGLMLFNLDSRKVDTLFHENNYCVRTIRIIDGYLFFGTYGKGFYIYKDGKLRQMPVDKNKYLMYAHCFMPDSKGFIWISTNHGLFKASKEDLIQAFEKNYNFVYYHYFGRNDGIDMTELNGGCTPCALEMRNKIMSFPTMDGLLWVDPEHSSPVLPSGNIFIDDILIDGEKVAPGDLEKKAMPARTKEIDVFTGLSAFCNKENIYLEYRLNEDPEWRPVNTEGDAVIHLINLPRGAYRLQIRKVNGFGHDNYLYRELLFSIATPWYKSWWFALLILIAVMAGLFLFYRIRTRQFMLNQQRLETIVAQKTKELQQKNEVLEKNDSIKTRLISIISHDIVTPLKFLHAAGKNLLQNRKLIPDALQEETISEIAQTSQDLQLLSTNILNWIKYQNENRRLVRDSFNVNEMVKQVTGVLGTIARQKNLQLLNETDPELTIYQYYEPLRIVLYNLISNAINFTEHGAIRISNGPVADENLSIHVSDQGSGMTPEQIQQILNNEYIISSANMDNKKGHGLGFLIIKDLLKMMNGKLSINSEKGKGTTVTISIPVIRQSGPTLPA